MKYYIYDPHGYYGKFVYSKNGWTVDTVGAKPYNSYEEAKEYFDGADWGEMETENGMQEMKYHYIILDENEIIPYLL
jgi:hypothetical protein